MERLSTQKDVLEPNKKDTPHTVHLNITISIMEERLFTVLELPLLVV